MTTRQIAEAAGVSVDTVQRKARELYPEKYQKGVKAIFAQKEAIAIMAKIRKEGFIQPTQNAEVPTQNAEVDRLARLEYIVEKLAETVAGMPSIMMQMVGGNQKQVEQLPAVQELSQRDQLRQAVNSYASKIGGYREAWGSLYQQFYYRYHRNVKSCAKSRGMDTLDYIEEEGLLPDLLALAIQLNA